MTASTNPSSQGFISTPIVPPLSLNEQPKPGWPTGVHPAAELFPLMKGPEFGLLVDDIEANGLREPILVYQGLILDGRNRLRACEIAGVDPRFVEWDGVGSPLAIVLSRNLHRRHLNEGQRAIIAARAKGMFEEEAAERERAHLVLLEPHLRRYLLRPRLRLATASRPTGCWPCMPRTISSTAGRAASRGSEARRV